jgi:transketolase
VLDTSRRDISKGAYVLWEPQGVTPGDLHGVIIATGSEVWLAREAAQQLEARGKSVRVVSMPCWEAFEALPVEARHAVLHPEVPTVSVEAGSTLGWDRYADVAVGIDRFGMSAPGEIVLDRLGINADHVATTALDLLDAVEQY